MIDVHRLLPSEHDAWCRMRMTLWPELRADECVREKDEILADPRQEVFIATCDDGRAVGFVEAAIKDWAPGCATHPIGYVEGWYVESEHRLHGVGRALFAATEDWARSFGCREMASDTEIDNTISQIAHGRLGYEVAEWGISFRKALQ